MKKAQKLLTVLAILIAIQMMFSCKTSKVDIVKRHYRTGYFVSIGSNKKEHKRKVNSFENEKAPVDTATIGKTDTKETSEIPNENSDLNFTASTNNEILLTKTKPQTQSQYSAINIIKKVSGNGNLLERFINNKKTRKNNVNNSAKNASGNHDNLGKILKILGYVLAIAGVLIYLSAFPASEAGMAIGRILILLGSTSWIVGMFM
ncbi:MAG: hypothetical protein WC223_10770 [Bacteroidales bacterium]